MCASVSKGALMTELNHTQKVKRIYKNRTGQSDKWMLQFCFCGSLSIVGVKKKVENKRQRKNRLPLNNLRSMSNIKNTIAKPLKVSNTKTNTL